MRRLAVGLVLLAAIVAAPATALAVDENSVIGGPESHVHHVITGNGGCVAIDAVAFEPGARGLHRGANESGSQGPAHRGCP